MKKSDKMLSLILLIFLLITVTPIIAGEEIKGLLIAIGMIGIGIAAITGTGFYLLLEQNEE